ncbi:MAG: hypothetical protein IKW85_09405 [Muribaculaceae bacterium]|nr:hypothetical protein [Muribaculaceae bacterium]
MLLEHFKNFAEDKGITYSFINSEMIHFKKNNLDYIFQVDDRDKPYFRIILPNLLEVTDNNRNQIRNYIAEVNVEFKVGKIVEVDNSLWITAEMFVYSHLGIDSLFERLIEMLNEFHKRLKIDFQNNKLLNDEQIQDQ